MSPRKRDDVAGALIRKGFIQSNNDHMKFSYVNSAGKKTQVWTKISYGTNHKDIAAPNLSRMAKQCKLSNSDFAQLLDCPLSRENYEDMLVNQGAISEIKS